MKTEALSDLTKQRIKRTDSKMEKLIQRKIPLKQSIYLLALTCILQTSCFEQEAVEKGMTGLF